MLLPTATHLYSKYRVCLGECVKEQFVLIWFSLNINMEKVVVWLYCYLCHWQFAFIVHLVILAAQHRNNAACIYLCYISGNE